MAAEEYQANWRGARRYQFDEETRRKRAAMEARYSTSKPRSVGPWDKVPLPSVDRQRSVVALDRSPVPIARRRKEALSFFLPTLVFGVTFVVTLLVL